MIISTAEGLWQRAFRHVAVQNSEQAKDAALDSCSPAFTGAEEGVVQERHCPVEVT